MDEIAPGIWHWTALRETIGSEVSSYYLADERVAIDPMLPPERPDWFQPEHVLLTCRHHNRDAWELGCSVWVVEQGAHELEGRGEFRTYAWGDELPGGVRRVRGRRAEPRRDGPLHPGAPRARDRRRGRPLAEGRRPLGFVPDCPDGRSRRRRGAGLRAAYRRLLELDFDHLLLAHGDPVVRDAKEQLRAFVEA